MDQLGHDKKKQSQEENLLDGLTSIKYENNQMLNRSSSSLGDDSYLLQSIKKNIITQNENQATKTQEYAQEVISEEVFSNMIKAVQHEYQPQMTIEQRSQENFQSVNGQIKEEIYQEIEKKQKQAIEILKNKIIQMTDASSQLNFSQFNNIIQEQIKNIQEETNLLRVNMSQTLQTQPNQEINYSYQTQNTNYLIGKCQEIYDQLQNSNPEVFLQRIPQASDENSPIHQNMNIVQGVEIKNNADNISDISMDSSAIINMIPMDSKKHQISGSFEQNYRQNSPNKVLKIFNQKQHRYIKQICLNNDIQPIAQDKNQDSNISGKKNIQIFYVKLNNNDFVQPEVYSLRPNEQVPMEIQYINNMNNNNGENIPMDIQIDEQGNVYHSHINQIQTHVEQNIPMDIQVIQHRIDVDHQNQSDNFEVFLQQNHIANIIDNQVIPVEEQVQQAQRHLEQTNVDSNQANQINQEGQLIVQNQNQINQEQPIIFTQDIHQNDQEYYPILINEALQINLNQQPVMNNDHHQNNLEQQQIVQVQPTQSTKNNQEQNPMLLNQVLQTNQNQGLNIYHHVNNQEQHQIVQIQPTQSTVLSHLTYIDNIPMINNDSGYITPLNLQKPQLSSYQNQQRMLNFMRKKQLNKKQQIPISIDQQNIQPQNNLTPQNIFKKQQKSMNCINLQFSQRQNLNNLSLNVEHDNNFIQNLNDFTQILKKSSKKQSFELLQMSQFIERPNEMIIVQEDCNKKIESISLFNDQLLKNIGQGSQYRQNLNVLKQQKSNYENNEKQAFSLINILNNNFSQQGQQNFINLTQPSILQIDDNQLVNQKIVNQNNNPINQSFLLNTQFNDYEKKMDMRLGNIQKYFVQDQQKRLQMKNQQQRRRKKFAIYNVNNVNDVISSNNRHQFEAYQNRYVHNEELMGMNERNNHMRIPSNQQMYIPVVPINNFQKQQINQPIQIQLNNQRSLEQSIVNHPKENPRITISFGNNNEISLNIFDRKNVSNQVINKPSENIIINHEKSFIDKGIGLSPQRNSTVTLINSQNVQPQTQKLNLSTQSMQPKRQIPRQNHQKQIIITNLSTDDEQLPQNLPQRQKIINNSIIQSSFQSRTSRQSTQSNLDTYHNLIQLSQHFLLNYQDDKSIISQFQKVLNKHIYLRYTPAPKTTLGQQLFKNGLFLVAMITLITTSRTSPKIYTLYHIYMHIHNFYGQYIQQNKYIYNVQLQGVISRYEEYINQNYQKMLNKQIPQVQTIKRKNVCQVQQATHVNIESVDKVSYEQQTVPKNNNMKYQYNLIDQKVVNTNQSTPVSQFIKKITDVTYQEKAVGTSIKLENNWKPKPNRQFMFTPNNQMKIDIDNKQNKPQNKPQIQSSNKSQNKRQNVNFTIFDSNNHKEEQKTPENSSNYMQPQKDQSKQITPVRKSNIPGLNNITDLSQRLKKFQKKPENQSSQKAVTESFKNNEAPAQPKIQSSNGQKKSSNGPSQPRLNDLYEKYKKIRQNRKSVLVNNTKSNQQTSKESSQEAVPQQNKEQQEKVQKPKVKKQKHVQFVDIDEMTSQENDDIVDKRKKKGSVGKGRRKRQKDEQFGDNQEQNISKKGEIKRKSKK